MDLTKIISIAGKPGLYQIINQSRGGVVVSSLMDGKKMAIGQTQRVSSLSDISVYTEEGDEPLGEIFKKFADYADGEPIDLDLNDKDLLRDFFREILPNHDEARVYPSDIKKMIKWFNSMQDKGLINIESGESESSESENSSSAETEASPEKDEEETK
jgi:hypothetical protein